MRRIYLEIVRFGVNTMISMMLLGASIELQSNYLLIVALLTWINKIIAMTERSVTWRATRKKHFYKNKYRNNGTSHIMAEENNERMDIIGQNGNDGLHYDEE